MKGLPITLTLLVLILLSSYVHASEVEKNVLKNPAGVDEILVKVVFHGLIITDGHPSKITANISIPQTDERQTVELSIKKIKDMIETEICVIEEENPENKF